MDDAPATKRDIDELRQEIGGLRQEIHQEISGLREEMHHDLEAQENRVIEVVRTVETNLLKAFYGYVETARQRFAFLEGQSDNVMTRMRVIEDRVLEIEKRLNLPPAA